MRALVIDWLFQVVVYLKLNEDCIFRAVHIMDSYLSKTKKRITPNNLQLVGAMSLWVASKYEGGSRLSVDFYVDLSDNAFNRQQAISMETDILNTLEFNVSSPTPLHFLERYYVADSVLDEDASIKCLQMLEMCLLDLGYLRFTPSELAAAAVYVLRRKASESNGWPPAMIVLSTYTKEHIHNVAMSLLKLLQSLLTPPFVATTEENGTIPPLCISQPCGNSISYIPTQTNQTCQ